MIDFTLLKRRVIAFVLATLVSVVVFQPKSYAQVLLVDLDGNSNSALAMDVALMGSGLSVDYVTAFPNSLSGYSTLFVCLGIYNNNTQLSAAYGDSLAAFLGSGGNLYLEGGDTWAYDPPTVVHSLFNINGISDGANNLDSLVGFSGTLADGMGYSYVGDNSYIDHIEAISPAVNVFANTPTAYNCAVAYNAGSYRTIGTSFEFGGLQDDSLGNTKQALMNKYLQFFGLIPSAPVDLGVVAILSPGTPSNEGGVLPVDVIIQSFGADTVTAADVSYSIDGQTPVTMPWAGSLSFGERDTVSLGSITVPTLGFDLCAWTGLAADSINYNDTLCQSISVNPAFDAGVLDVLQPTGYLIEGDTVNAMVEVKNYGVDTITAMDIAYTIDNGTPSVENWIGILPPGDSEIITLSAVVVGVGQYELCAYTTLLGDVIHSNDTICATFFGNPANDAAMVEIMALPQIAGTYEMLVRIQNSGAAPLTSVNVQATLNSVALPAIAWTGNLIPGEISDYISIGSQIFTATTYDLVVNTQLPNGVADYYTNDDTLQTAMEFFAVSAIDTFPYCESFEADMGNWVLNTIGPMQWIRDANGTPSNNTGPSSAFDGTYYLYTEATNIDPGDKARVEAEFDFSTISLPRLSFAFNMDGNTMGTLYVDVFDSIWHENVWSISGDQGSSWYQAELNIFDFGGKDQVVVRFRGERGSDYQSDIAIDNVCVSQVIGTDLAVNTVLQPALDVCASASESVTFEVENLGGLSFTDVPFVLEVEDPLGVTSLILDTLTGLFSGISITTIEVSGIDFSTVGTYSLTAYFDIVGDENTVNDTLVYQVSSVATISSLPFIEDFENGNSFFARSKGTLANVQLLSDSSNTALQLTGGNLNQGWQGGSGTTSQNAWDDNTTHHSMAYTCGVDASLVGGLMLEVDLRQTYTFYPVYSWFRVLVNDSIELADINGNAYFNPATIDSDPYTTLKFNLFAYAGSQFTLTFQGSCKYDGTYNSSSYPEGDQALIDNVILYEPLQYDAAATGVLGFEEGLCGSANNPVEVEIANLGVASISNVPVSVTVTSPSGGLQTLSANYTNTILPGEVVGFQVGNISTIAEGGLYDISVEVDLPSDGDLTNNVFNTQLKVLEDISIFPFEESFVSDQTDFFTVEANSLAKAYYYNDGGDTVLRLEGSYSTGWIGQSGNVTADNAWLDNYDHQSFVRSCEIDASNYVGMHLEIDFRQTGITTITDYSWFRVLLNDSIQLADVQGVSDFNPTDPQGDPYQVRTFDLSDYVANPFSITLQSACKYDSTLYSGGTYWVEGDAVYIRSIRLVEPPAVDIMVTGLLNVPDPSCDLGGNQNIAVQFVNNGTDTISAGTVIPFNIGTNGVVMLDGMTVQYPIAYGQTETYTFNMQPGMSQDGTYDVIAWSVFPGDTINENDTATAFTENVMDIDTFPYFEDFETGSLGWSQKTTAGTDEWELGTPNQNFIDSAYSGQNAWMTDLDGNYPDNSEMILYTPCFDLSNMASIQVSFWLNIDMEANYDGMVMEGTADGIIWTRVGLNDPDFYNSWTNASGSPVIEAPWWTGNNYGWYQAIGSLNEFSGESGVRLRLRFRTDVNTNREGVAVDNFKIEEIFDCFIDGPVNICEGTSTTLTALPSGGVSPFTYLWGNGLGTTQSITVQPTTASSYSVTVSDANGNQAVNEVEVEVFPSPVVNLGSDMIGTPPFVLNAGAGFDSYFWSNFETTQIIQVNSGGLYSVTVTDTIGCTGSDSIVITILGLNEIAQGDLKLYPNPSTGAVTCVFDFTSIEKTELLLTNTLGQVIFRREMAQVDFGKQEEFDFSFVPSGTYFFFIRNNQVSKVKKLVFDR